MRTYPLLPETTADTATALAGPSGSAWARASRALVHMTVADGGGFQGDCHGAPTGSPNNARTVDLTPTRSLMPRLAPLYRPGSCLRAQPTSPTAYPRFRPGDRSQGPARPHWGMLDELGGIGAPAGSRCRDRVRQSARVPRAGRSPTDPGKHGTHPGLRAASPQPRTPRRPDLSHRAGGRRPAPFIQDPLQDRAGGASLILTFRHGSTASR